MGWWRITEGNPGFHFDDVVDADFEEMSTSSNDDPRITMTSGEEPAKGGLINMFPQQDDPNNLYNGDAPADIMGDAIDKIVEAYQEAWGRPPCLAELKAVFDFETKPLFSDDGAYVGLEAMIAAYGEGEGDPE